MADAATGWARSDLRTLLAARGVREDDLEPDAGGTLAPRHVVETAPTLQDQGGDAPGGEATGAAFDPGGVVLGEALAAGGVGVVHLATQPALKREVAAKILRPDRLGAESVAALLREAWITGYLEHPHIVPVHLLTSGEQGPVMVMKRIEGTSWTSLLEDPSALTALHRGDPFEWHLRVLITVCHAVHFAHSRGIIHLDLKPCNVMVGRYGEVYLVDWGVAASLPSLGPAWLPSTATIASVCGTPAYMAPEQASADTTRLGVASDVYGLGAILHELVTGERRHDGATMRETLLAAYHNAPARYGPDVPDELARILARATATEPRDRFPSAEALREALEGFLSHRASIDLSDQASSRLAALEDRLAGGDLDPALQREFFECRLTFRQALVTWPDNPAARAGLRALLVAMASYAVDRGQRDRAAECLAELDSPAPELASRLAALDAHLAAETERVRALERDADPNLFHRDRSLLAAITGVVWLVWNVACGWLHKSGILVFGFEELLVMNLATFTLFIVAAVVTRKTLLTTATNRRALWLFGAGFATVLLFWVCAHIVGVDPIVALALSGFIYVYFAFALSFVIDRRAAWVVPALIPLSIASAATPEYAFEIAGVIGLITGAWLAILWRRPSATAHDAPALPRARAPRLTPGRPPGRRRGP